MSKQFSSVFCKAHSKSQLNNWILFLTTSSQSHPCNFETCDCISVLLNESCFR